MNTRAHPETEGRPLLFGGRACAVLFVLSLLFCAGLAAQEEAAAAPAGPEDIAALCLSLKSEDAGAALHARRALEEHIFRGPAEQRDALADALLQGLGGLTDAAKAEGTPSLLPEDRSLMALVAALPVTAQQCMGRLRLNQARRDVLYWLGFVLDASRISELSAYIQDSDIGEDAINAVLRIGGPGCVGVLLGQLDASAPDRRRSLVHALGVLRAPEAESRLRELAQAGSGDLRWIALDALSRMGIPAAKVVPLAADMPPRLAARYMLANLRAALQLAESGKRAEAQGLLLAFADVSARRAHIIAALIGLARVDSDKLVPTALGFVNTPGVRATAVRALIEAKSANINAQLAKVFPVTDPSMQAAILEILQQRNAQEYGPILEEARSSPQIEVRTVAAWLNGAEATQEDLWAMAEAGPPWMRAAAVDHLEGLAHEALSLGDRPDARAAFLRILEGRYSDEMRGRALAGLEQLADPATRSAVEPYTKDPVLGEAAAKAFAAILAAQPDAEDARAELQDLALSTRHESASGAAVAALQRQGVSTENVAAQRGYITNWRVLGPLPNQDGAAFGMDFFNVKAGDPPASVQWEESILEWKPVVVEGVPAVLDLAAALGPAEHVAAYAFAVIRLQKAQPVEICLGTDDGCEVWLNGAKLNEVRGPRLLKPDEDRLPAMLKPGLNRLVIKVLQETGPWAFCARVTDRRGTALDLTTQGMPDDGAAGVGASVDTLRPVLGDSAP